MAEELNLNPDSCGQNTGKGPELNKQGQGQTILLALTLMMTSWHLQVRFSTVKCVPAA